MMESNLNPNAPEDDFPNIPYHPFKNKETARSLQTLLRNENRSFLRFIAMVDNKANIMIHLNSLILSGLAIFSKFFAPFPEVEKVALIFLLLACIASLSLAALAARPVHKMMIDISEHHKGYLFAKMLVKQVPQDEFLHDFDALIRDQGLIYKNMGLEFYTLSKILRLKNKRLRRSYNIFLLGIVLTGAIILLYNILHSTQL